jgi:hypothetical protein
VSGEGYFQAAAWVAAVIFFAGGAWWQIAQLRKDLNGLGMKLGALDAKLIKEKEEAAKWRHNESLAILLATPQDRQRDVADFLKQN